MRSIFITSQKYDIALDRLLSRRLEQSDCVYALAVHDGGISVTVRTRASLTALCQVLLQFMCRDIIYFELAQRADKLPLELSEKQEVLKNALREARAHTVPADAQDALFEYLSGADTLNLEGYLQFRLRAQTVQWMRCLEHAAAEQMLRREYAALLGLIAAKQPPRIRELYICLNADGSCTFSDDSNAMIEYTDCSNDGILSLLVSMAPAYLTVYDLSGGRARALADAITDAFVGRVRVYR